MRNATTSGKALKKAHQDSQTVEYGTKSVTVDTLLEHAIKARAMAIHIEPQAVGARVRYRIDGLLVNTDSLTKDITANLLQRFKTLGGLHTEETQLPQEGHFKMRVGGAYSFALHVATMPVSQGEKLVITIRQESETLPTFAELGLWGDSLQRLMDALQTERGLMLVGGLHDSGTSTTAYALLHHLNTSNTSVATIEDAITHHLNGVSQSAINHRIGLTHASGLRAMLKQDANIVMVDDVREPDTAHLASTAALGGHLVLGVVRAPSALASISRLQAMGIEPYVIAATLRLATGQVLVRRLCDKCKQSFVPSKEVATGIFNTFGIKNKEYTAQLLAHFTTASKAGIGSYNSKHPPLTSKTITQLWKPDTKGCTACNHSGFKGRLGLYEILVPSEGIQKLITSHATDTMLHNQAVAEGMVPLKIDGLVKALLGSTTIDEVIRALSVGSLH